MHIRNSLATKYQLKLKILNFWTKSTQKGYFRSKKSNRKENQHRILHIRIRLGSKVQLEWIILTFGTNLPKKGYFWSKTENNEHHH